MSTQVRCPACGAFAGFRPSRPRKLWEKALAKVAGIRAYRCKACGRRMLRRRLPLVEDEESWAVEAWQAQAPPVSEQSTDEFNELIRTISAAERSYESQEPGTR